MALIGPEPVAERFDVSVEIEKMPLSLWSRKPTVKRSKLSWALIATTNSCTVSGVGCLTIGNRAPLISHPQAPAPQA